MTVYDDAQRFTRDVERLNNRALARMVAELERILPGLEAQAVGVAERVQAMRDAGAPVSELQQFAARRARTIAAEVRAECNRLAAAMAGSVASTQDAALQRGVDAATALIEGQLPDGVSIARIAPGFERPPLEALRAAVGSQQGAPLRELFAALGDDAGRKARDTLLSGLAAGKNPRVMARDLRRTVGLSAVRAEAISRTETLRSFRAASLMTYQAAGITRYRRLAARSVRTCAACLALDGQEQDAAEVMAVHVQDRCSTIPIIEGLTPPPTETGADWLARQPAEVQVTVLGKGGAAAYQRGVPLERFARVEQDPQWGATVRVATLSEVSA